MMNAKDALLAASGLLGGNGSGGTAPTLIPKTVTANGTYAAADDSADGYSSVTVDVQGGGLNTITIDVASYRSYDTASSFVADIASRIGVTYFVFEAIFNNNTNNTRAGIWIGGANSSYGVDGRAVRVGAAGNFSYGIDVYAGSSITINYMAID